MSVIDFLINLGLPVVEEGEKEGVDILLEKLFATDPDAYKAAIFGFSAGFKALKPKIDGSSSKLVKGLVGAFADEINESAAKHGVVLETPPTVNATAGTAPGTETEAGPTTGSNAPA